MHKTKSKRVHPDFKSKTICIYLKFHCVTFHKNSILLATLVLLFLQHKGYVSTIAKSGSNKPRSQQIPRAQPPTK